jgi:AbrB family looped-hinge helix DNA binding protein
MDVAIPASSRFAQPPMLAHQPYWLVPRVMGLAWKMPLMASTVSIDKAGRLVLPKPLRDKLELEAGDDLLVESEGDEIILRPVRPEALFARKQGIWVHNGQLPDNFDIVEFVDQEREKRNREFWD